MRLAKLLTLALLVVSMAAAQEAPSSTSAENRAENPKLDMGFTIKDLDTTVKPCDDFYHYACGTWIKNNPVPPDKSSYGRFTELYERNRAILHDILEKGAANDPKRSAVEQKYGDYYAACMDETAINKKGLSLIEPELTRIAVLKSKADLPALSARLQLLGVGDFFGFGSEQDAKDSTQQIAATYQGGLGLPDRDYYFRADAKSVEIRKQYVEHVQDVLELLGEKPQEAAAHAKSIMEIETQLAKGALDRATRRDPNKVYHKLTAQQLQALSPSFHWATFFTDIGTPGITSLNVSEPEFVKQMETVLKSTSLSDMKEYLRWHLVNSQSLFLPKKFDDAHFDFYSRTLRGQKQQEVRWKRCVSSTDDNLGEAVGQAYVDRTFGVEGKQRTLKMVNALEAALQQDIQDLPWMTEATKKQALIKLHGIANKIGYPDKWRDYSKLNIVRGDALGNSLRADEFEARRQLAKIGKPVDKMEWQMTPPTVNAYYDPQMNNINFPAGILQPPFYDNNMDDAVNFGGIGAVIGHELTHGFDDQGRQFDAQGNLRDWWTPADAKAFEQRASCIVNEYDAFTVPGDVHVNGKLTLGENTADSGGLRIAYMALMDTLAKQPTEDKKPINGFAPDQRIFLGWGQIWCDNMTPEFARLLAQTNEHSPDEYRVNGVVSNMPEFAKAYSCKQGDKMVRADACRVW